MDHRFDVDSDRCVCGGIVVYFEDGSLTGEGCEVEGMPWKPSFPVRVAERGPFWAVVDRHGAVITTKYDEWTALEAADRLNDHAQMLHEAEQAGMDVSDL